MRMALLYVSCAMLCGCNAVTENVVRANQKFQSMIHTSAKRVQHWTDPKQTNFDVAGQPDTRYCYKSLGDIVCYNEPQPTMSNPLFGYQGYAEPQMIQQETVMLAPQQSVSARPQDSQKAESTASAAQADKGEPLALMPRQ